ncbi:hypothetical protein [Modestobacter sp. I12A-02662]|uniref:hypothetical protein n=1 Tax=Modestobacter sp. I12A-02662 TaxID=1730496 RepID=UPI0034DFA043
MPTTTPSARAASSLGTVLAGVCALLAAGVALAGPAAAIEDPRRPTVAVTHGPSCGPGVLRAVVTNGEEGHRVALWFDGTEELAAAELGPGEQVELVSRDVDWGETVDVSVTVADLDGTPEEPLEQGTYTRPSVEDCAATAVSAAGTGIDGAGLPAASVPEPADTRVPAPSGTPDPPAQSAGTPPVPSTPDPTAPDTDPSGTSASAGDASPTPAGQASVAAVAPGGVLTVRASGFTPGERVIVSLADAHRTLTTVTAGSDGGVEAVVQIPRGAELGAATVQLVGRQSAATTAIDLQVTARAQPRPGPAGSPSTTVAVVSLLGAGGVLGLTAARRSREPTSGV